MEWINEGVMLIFIGATLFIVSLVDPAGRVSVMILWADFIALIVLSAISLFTGSRIDFMPFRLCPVIFGLSAALILAGMYL